MVELLEHQHLLRKRIDDDLSRTAFATYLDRLDSNKMFLLRKDRDALLLFAWAELSYEEIAQSLGISARSEWKNCVSPP